VASGELPHGADSPPAKNAAREDLGTFGGVGSGEGQGEYGGDGYSAMGDFTDGGSEDRISDSDDDPGSSAAREREVNPNLGFQNRHGPIPNTHQP
jgi:hypothetical protein